MQTATLVSGRRTARGAGPLNSLPSRGRLLRGLQAALRELSPSNLVGFNGGVLFEGKDLSGRFGLWVTTGTAAGTQEIAGTSGLSPNDLTIFGGQVLFSGGSGLWATNGTAAGTHEVTSVAGAPGDLTVFGCEVLFAGATGGCGRQNGSSGGTHELAGTAGLNPFDLTVFGSEVLFASGGGVVGDERRGRQHPDKDRQRHAAGHGCLQRRGAVQPARWRRGRPCGRRRALPAAPRRRSAALRGSILKR